MMAICGVYVETFAEASHAMPQGMHMDADYPFMLPRIVGIENGVVTIEQGGQRGSFRITRRSGATGEVGYLEQSSSFERLFRRKPQRFEMLPFKDEKSPAVGR